MPLYGVGSVSKIYTTAAAMHLAESGSLALDEPITTYLPGFTMADARYEDITLRMLLNHSSGLMFAGMHDAFLFDDAQNRTAVDSLLTELSTQRLIADPGAYSVYNNTGFTLAQLVIEQVSGHGRLAITCEKPSSSRQVFPIHTPAPTTSIAPASRLPICPPIPPALWRRIPWSLRARRHICHGRRPGPLWPACCVARASC